MKNVFRPAATLSFLFVAIAFAERPFCNRFDAFWDNNPVQFSVNGSIATMNGVIGSSTPDAVRNLLRDHPQVTAIHLDYVPGSENDSANVVAARLVRNAGLATHIVSNGVVSSGGVDFFLAGASRTIDPGVCEVGVHSWGSGSVIDASVFPRTDPRHLLYLRYYRDMGIDDEFYFFTLNAADADNIYNMDDDDIAAFAMTGVAINPGPPKPDIRIGARANRQVGNNRYNRSGGGQAIALRLLGKRPKQVHFSVENDSPVFDYDRVRSTRWNRKFSVRTFRMTGGRTNVTAAIQSRGHALPSLGSGARFSFLTIARAKSVTSRVRAVVTHTFSSDLVPSVRDVAKARVTAGK